MAEKRGRPKTVLDEDQIKSVEKLAAVLTKEQLADYLGISRRSFFDIEDRQPEVRQAYLKGRSKALTNIATNLMKQAVSGNTTAAIFYLKTQGGWSEKIEFSGDVESRVTLNLGGKDLDPDDLGW